MDEMAFRLEIVNDSNKAGKGTNRSTPKWVTYAAVAVGVLFLIGILKRLIPLITLVLLVTIVLRLAGKRYDR